MAADDKSPSAGSPEKPSKPVIRGKGKGKALNAIAAASGRDPAAIVKSVTEAEAAAKAAAARAKAEEAARRAAKLRAEAKAREEVTSAQVFDSLNPREQYRFECFRRCGFASRPVERFVARMLIDEAEKRYLARRGVMDGLGGRSKSGFGGNYDDAASNKNNVAAVTDASDVDSSSKKPNAPRPRKRKKQSKNQILREESKRRRAAMDQPLPYFVRGGEYVTVGGGSTGASAQTPPLDNLVVPSSASEIVAVVSTLAKCYGQRLVAAAKRVADAEEEEKKTDETRVDLPSTAQKPLLPHHFLEAHRHRAIAGIDPGFWMAGRTDDGKKGSTFNKGGVGTAEAAALGRVDRDRTCYLAALAAQDAYDREAGKEEEEDEQKGEGDKMEVEEIKGG